MAREYIGKDSYGKDMYMYYSCNKVYVDHEKNGVVTRTAFVEVDNDIIMMFGSKHISGAFIYDVIRKRYRKKL